MIITLGILFSDIIFIIDAAFAQPSIIHHGFLLFKHVEAFGQDRGLLTILIALTRGFGRSANGEGGIVG